MSTRSQRNYAAVWERDKSLCVYCGAPGEEIDHVMPWSHVMSNAIDNLVVSCSECNRRAHNLIFTSMQAKADYLQAERRAKLLRDFPQDEIRSSAPWQTNRTDPWERDWFTDDDWSVDV